MRNYCENCGSKLKAQTGECLNCGKVIDKYSKEKDIKDPYQSMAVAGFILSLIGMFSWLIPLLGFPISICGINYSTKGLKSKDKGDYAIIGLIFALIYFCLSLFNFIVGIQYN